MIYCISLDRTFAGGLLTFTPKLAEPVSKPIVGKQPLAFADLLQRAEAVFPTAKLTDIYFSSKPEDPFNVGKKQSQESGEHGNTQISLARFTGEVIQVKDGVKPSRADAILNQFGAAHFGTFGVTPTRILYFFVGLAPTILAITGLTMFRFSRRAELRKQKMVDPVI